MHVHTVLVKLKDPSLRDACSSLMESMRGEIADMIDLEVRVNDLEGSYSADLSLTTTWTDRDAYDRYTQDAVHLAVREQVLELMADAMTIDYVADEPSDK